MKFCECVLCVAVAVVSQIGTTFLLFFFFHSRGRFTIPPPFVSAYSLHTLHTTTATPLSSSSSTSSLILRLVFALFDDMRSYAPPDLPRASHISPFDIYRTTGISVCVGMFVVPVYSYQQSATKFPKCCVFFAVDFLFSLLLIACVRSTQH